MEFERFMGYGSVRDQKLRPQDFYRVCRGVLLISTLRGAMPCAAGTRRVDGVEVDVRTCSTPSPQRHGHVDGVERRGFVTTPSTRPFPPRAPVPAARDPAARAGDGKEHTFTSIDRNEYKGLLEFSRPRPEDPRGDRSSRK